MVDHASLRRIQAFMQLIDKAKNVGVVPNFVSTPTEHGDNINAVAVIEGERANAGLLYWDVTLLQDHGLLERLDEEELALGLTVTDGLIEDTEKILCWVETELKKVGTSSFE